MSWARSAVQALRKIILLDERLGAVADKVARLSDVCDDLDRRLARLEGKFELLESMGAARRKRLPPSS